jgi:hypothetical protein
MIVVMTRMEILEQLMQPDQGNLPSDVARFVLKLDFPRSVHDRYASLSAKAQDGSLSVDERSELEEYLAADALLTAIQSKARISLKQHSPAA